MKKHFIFLLIALATFALLSSGCEKVPHGGDGPGSYFNTNLIDAKNVIHSNEQIVTVKALAETNDTWDEEVIANCSYQNNSFKLVLPKTLQSKYLFEISDEFEDWVEISDRSVKMGVMWLYAYSSKDKIMGDFYLQGAYLGNYVETNYVYADRNCTVKGKFQYFFGSIEYDCAFKRGWNIIYYIEDYWGENIIITTQKPAEVEMRWYFDENYNWNATKIRFIKEIDTEKCTAMGFKNTNNYYEDYYYFGYSAGTSYYFTVPPGNYNFLHYDDTDWYGTWLTDITDYNIEEESNYSVVCSVSDGELYFYVTKDAKSDEMKIAKFKSLINRLKYKIAKDKKV